MKRVLLAMLMTVLAVAVGASDASADKKKKGPAKSAKQKAAPSSEKISEAMGEMRWGMDKDALNKFFLDKVKEKYRPLLAKTKDAVEEDRLRQQARQEADALKKGAVEFDGRSTGWDVSFLKGEFAQNNGESMLVVRDANSQNFYFFMNGKLWKWYKAFDASVFPANNFGTFAGSVQKRFGNAKDSQGELRPGEGQVHWLEWQDKQTRLRAVDETGFYGFYCLVFEEKSTADNLAKLRKGGDQGGDKRHALVDSVTAERNVTNPDDSSNVVDRITGRMHQNEQRPEPGAEGATASSKAKSKGKSESAPEPAKGVSKDDDPISGLGL